MSKTVQDSAELVPVGRREVNGLNTGALPSEHRPTAPPRVHLSEAHELVNHVTRWGERGRDFLKAVFFETDRTPRDVLMEEILDHCLKVNSTEGDYDVRRAALHYVECLKSCGVIIRTESAIMKPRYSLNSAPGIELLITEQEEPRLKRVTRAEFPLDSQKARLFLAEDLGAPFVPGCSVKDLILRLQEPTLISSLMKDSTLFVPDYILSGRLRERISFYLSEGLRLGIIAYERVENRDKEVMDLFILTTAGARYLEVPSITAGGAEPLELAQRL